MIKVYVKGKPGGGGVQGQGKGQRLMSIFAVTDSIGLATCQSKSYEKYPPLESSKICLYGYPVWTAATGTNKAK